MTRKIDGMKWHEDDEELMRGEILLLDGEVDSDGLFDNSDSMAMGDMGFIDF